MMNDGNPNAMFTIPKWEVLWLGLPQMVDESSIILYKNGGDL